MPRVAKREIESQLAKIADLLREHPAGLSRDAIAVAYQARHGVLVASRTLQRRLETLVEDGRVTSAGEGSATRYGPGQGHAPAEAPEVGYVPVTKQGARVRAMVRKLMLEKKPVGYVADWLLEYRPGTTWYLTKADRAHLHELGRTPDDSRPAGTFARDILGRLLIDLAWASSRLEGNTYTRLDTQNLLEFGQQAEGRDAEETQMILNHKTAIEYLVGEPDGPSFDRATLRTLHAMLSENLLGDPADEGRLRERPVNITGTSYTPIGIPQVIRECFDRIVGTVGNIPDPFEQAFFAMVHIPYLQPFADVNKRTSRLAANIPLVKANLCPLSFVDVPEQAYIDGTLGVYEHRRVELLRDVFVWAYERSCAQYRVIRDSVIQPDPFRLRYRAQFDIVVADFVRAGAPPRKDTIREWARDNGVPAGDAEGFTELALSLLVNLNEGSAGRYRLRPSEFSAWKARVTT